MKILIISPTSKGIGGVARHVQGLTNFLEENGHNVDILSSDNTFTIPIRKLKNPSFMVSSFFKTKLKKKYDIVHAQNIPAAIALKGASGKKIISLHGIHNEQVELLHGSFLGNAAKNFERYALECVDAITVSSKEMYEHYTKLGYIVHYIPNSIDISNLPKETDRKYKKQIIYAARLSKEKGILDVLEMSLKLPKDIHILILGTGPEKKKVLDACKTKSNIHYLGYQEQKKVIEIIRGSDILIQPSLVEGGTSYTLLESMACKTPIICSDVGGGKDVLHHLKNSYIIKPNNPSELLNAIIELMNDDNKRKQLGKNGYDSILKYDWKIIGKNYLELYSQILNLP